MQSGGQIRLGLDMRTKRDGLGRLNQHYLKVFLNSAAAVQMGEVALQSSRDEPVKLNKAASASRASGCSGIMLRLHLVLQERNRTGFLQVRTRYTCISTTQCGLRNPSGTVSTACLPMGTSIVEAPTKCTQ